ncbi:hypothetical protein C4580_05260 [Candidatus Woesearchaeota archaeon]|nr:MAG: hypothetical protein C4580_05260 [Candidatus Woesearchaeota archaeon]
MKTEITSLDLLFLCRELQTLVGSRVDKIYRPDGFLFQLHKTGSGKLFLRTEKNAVWLAAAKTETPETPGGLCSTLRKYLEGKKLTSLEQVNGERILKLTFQTQQDTYSLYIELFSNGNIVLADEHGIVKAAQEERAWKDREIKRGKPYALPPAKKNFTQISPADLDSTTPISKHLATLGLGKTYAEELCLRAGTDPTSNSLTENERITLHAYLQKLLKEPISAFAYPDGEITPFALSGKTGTAYPSFSAAIDANLSKSAALTKLEKSRARFDSEKERIQNAITIQERTLTKINEDAAKQQRAGELIYEHYQELKNILDQLHAAKKKHSLQEIAQKLKGHAVIKHVNPKTQEITVEITDD